MPLMVSLLKTTVFQSISVLRQDAEHGDLAAVAHVGEHVAEGVRVARHLQPDVEAFLHAQLLLRVGDRCRCATSSASVGAHLAGQVQPVGVDVGDDDVAGAGVPGDGGRHDADRARRR